jgi:hypothetical protein
MARPSKMPSDPEVYEQMLESLALGVPQVLIAESLEIKENTLSTWKTKKDFRRDLARKKLEVLQPTVSDFRERYPKEYLERHPDTRSTWAPPKLQAEFTGPALQITVNQVILELTGRYDKPQVEDQAPINVTLIEEQET